MMQVEITMWFFVANFDVVHNLFNISNFSNMLKVDTMN